MTKKTKTPVKKIKNKNMNVKFPESDYMKLQEIAEDIGGMTLSAMVRMLIYAQLEEVEKTGNPRAFLGIKGKQK